jgi:hypothetical protein
MCLQRGRVLINASASHAQDTITAALAASTGAHAENPFVVLAGDIDKQGESWGQLLQKLQQKNQGDIKDTLSESVLAVQLLQSRLTKLSANAAAECAGVQVAVASACSKMMKVGVGGCRCYCSSRDACCMLACAFVVIECQGVIACLLMPRHSFFNRLSK